MGGMRKARWLLAALACTAGTSAGAGELFKCGKVFQDRPCESVEVQQRFSSTQGTFAIEQVNGATDKECAKSAADAMGSWSRLAAGEPLESLHAEVQAQNVSREEKSRRRDALTALAGYKGTPREVRGQLEAQCMATRYKTATTRRATSPMESARAAEMEARRAEADARRAEAEARRAEADAQRAAARARMTR